MPLFSADYYNDPPKSLDYLAGNLKQIAESTDNVEFLRWAHN